MFKYYLRFIWLTVIRGSYLIGMQWFTYIACKAEYPVDPALRVPIAILIAICLVDLSLRSIAQLIDKHTQLIKEREDMPIEQIGKYHRYWYDGGRKLSKKYTSYVAAHRDWSKLEE